jgi:hypothetical protein
MTTFFSVGQSGSCANSRAFKMTTFPINPMEAFSPKKYLLADFGYRATRIVIPAYCINAIGILNNKMTA